MDFLFYVYYGGEDSEVVHWIKEFQNVVYDNYFKETQVVLNIKNVAGLKHCFINTDPDAKKLNPLQFCISKKCLCFTINSSDVVNLNPTEVLEGFKNKVEYSEISVTSIGF